MVSEPPKVLTTSATSQYKTVCHCWLVQQCRESGTPAAFVELGLGFMLLICLFGRSLSVTITLVFFLTTMVFGKVEIIGHTLVHASLIVFLFEGPGHTIAIPQQAAAPSRLRQGQLRDRRLRRSVCLQLCRQPSERTQDSTRASKIRSHRSGHGPDCELEVLPDSKSGWNIHIITTNFRFTPDTVGGETIEGEGHAHLYLDGQKIARVYGEWYHLPKVEGEHELRVTLNTNDHQDYAVAGDVVGASRKLGDPTEERRSTAATALRTASDWCVGLQRRKSRIE